MGQLFYRVNLSVVLLLFGFREVGCFGKVAALYSDH